MKPIIGIVGRCQNNDGYSLIGVVDQLRNAVIKCGGIPILILPTQLIEYDNIKEDTPNKLTEEEKEDLIRQINDEIAILKGYLPEELSEEEIRKIVEESIKETGATTIKDMGKVMQMAKTKAAGRADSKIINDIVREFLK